MRVLSFIALSLAMSAALVVEARLTRKLRVCADPNNLPFTNVHGEGFENDLAELLAKELGAELEYTWWAQRRGFFRNTLKAKTCDVVLGVPSGLEMVQTTKPYYRSAYAFVTRTDRALDIRSLDDTRLRSLRIGAQVIGDDGANSPPVHALARRGIVENVVGYSVIDDYERESPPAEIVHAVARGDIDVAIVWGPLAGAFAKRSDVALTVTLVTEAEDGGVPLAFDIAMGVRHGDDALAEAIDRALHRRRARVTTILAEHGIPVVVEAPR